MDTNNNTNTLPLLVVVILAVLIAILIYIAWVCINTTKEMNNWKIINKEMEQCGHDIKCQRAVLYRHGEGHVYEEAVKNCYAKYKEKCMLTKAENSSEQEQWPSMSQGEFKQMIEKQD